MKLLRENIEVETGPLQLMHQPFRKYPTPEITKPFTQIGFMVLMGNLKVKDSKQSIIRD